MNYKNLAIVAAGLTLSSWAFGTVNHVTCKKKSTNNSIKISIKNKYATITEVADSKALSPTYYKLTGRVGLSSAPRDTPRYDCQGSRGEIKIFDRFAKVGDTYYAVTKIGKTANKTLKKKITQKKYAALSDQSIIEDFIPAPVTNKTFKPKPYRGKVACSQTWRSFEDIEDFTINIFQKNGALIVKQSAPTAIFSPEKFRIGSAVSFNELPTERPVYNCVNSKGTVKVWDDYVVVNKKAFSAKLMR